MPSSDWMANTMPPLAEPSSLVSTTPVTSTASVNCRAWTRPFWPVVASMTSSTSVTCPGGSVGHPPHLAQLLHEVDLGVQAAGGVGQHEVGARGRGPLDGVEDDRARVAALGAADEVGARPLGPQLELLGGRGPERVARRP